MATTQAIDYWRRCLGENFVVFKVRRVQQNVNYLARIMEGCEASLWALHRKHYSTTRGGGSSRQITELHAVFWQVFGNKESVKWTDFYWCGGWIPERAPRSGVRCGTPAERSSVFLLPPILSPGHHPGPLTGTATHIPVFLHEHSALTSGMIPASWYHPRVWVMNLNSPQSYSINPTYYFLW